MRDLLALGDQAAKAIGKIRYVMHEGRLYDLAKKFDQNCVKMHAQRFLAKTRAAKPLKKPSRRQRRAGEVIARKAQRQK